MAAEASKLLQGVDAVALHLAKTALARDASVTEAPNVGKPYIDLKTSADASATYRPRRLGRQLKNLVCEMSC